MCRLLYIKSKQQFDLGNELKKFAQICENSTEYQGHGWGCAYLVDNEWVQYRSITPIWHDNLDQFKESTVLLGHARSAFRNENIELKNNMPFYKNNLAFIFNGELHGVKIKENGRIGAEKIFNFIMRYYDNNLLISLEKAIPILESRTRYIKALNLIICDKKHAYVVSQFNDQPDYFTLHFVKNPSKLIICSDPLAGEKNWHSLNNRTIQVF
jgi:glutamine amidotransferase